MLVKTFGSALNGVDATTITIEVNVGPGSKFFLVGLPDNAIKESQQRIFAAVRNNGYKWPGRRITINMAPADIRKEGAAYDLPIALGVLAASEQINHNLFSSYLIMGELSLDGSIHPIKGGLSMAMNAKSAGFRGIILPKQSAKEASMVSGIEVYGANHMEEVIRFMEIGESGEMRIRNQNFEHQPATIPQFDFSDVKGQENIKRALEIAAAGGHNVLLIGPPGAGKTMLAKRMSTILPPLQLKEALETTKVHSVAGLLGPELPVISLRPFRSPHHSISDVALVGGGTHPMPGEISLAHNGILFLDELPEFKRTVLEVLRQPMEERRVTISRARNTVDFPASFMLIASMNPCPCGFFNHPKKTCVCPPGMVQKYLNKISGPLLDRMDLHVEVTPVEFEEMSSRQKGENSLDVRKRVIEARKIQLNRFNDSPTVDTNAQMTAKQLQRICVLNEASMAMLKMAMEKLQLSARAYDRILKVARTIADLNQSENIETPHIAEAIQYRSLDRENWA